MFLLTENHKLYAHLMMIAFICLALTLRQAHMAGILLKLNMLVFAGFLAINISNKNAQFINIALKLALFPVSMILLSLIATGGLSYKEDAKNYLQAYFLAISLYAFTQHKASSLLVTGHHVAKVILVLFTVIQLASITLFHWGDFGTATNPHFLALYAGIGFATSIYYFNKEKSALRHLFLLTGAILLGITLYTSSRPVWIGMIVSTMFLIPLLNRKNAAKFLVLFFLIQAALITLNPFNYADRFYDLASNIQTEERVIIWKDAWSMQKDASTFEWIVGHGLNNFYAHFKHYSHYHPEHDFRSPHNLLLEILFSSGLLGLSIVLLFFTLLFKTLASLKKDNRYDTGLITLLQASLTISMFLNGLNWTFHSSSSIYPVSFIAGMTLLLAYRHNTPKRSGA